MAVVGLLMPDRLRGLSRPMVEEAPAIRHLARASTINLNDKDKTTDRHSSENPAAGPHPAHPLFCAWIQHVASRPLIIGRSAPIESVMRLIRIYAASPATVLVTGESGTGKELVAQSLHRLSQRADGPFVPVNCAAIPKDLLESELFGHRKGSFSGAIADRTGRFELANGGTLFLDEIGDMSLDMQVKLLRVLQERVVDPIGSTRQVAVDVRVVAATHRDLEVEVAAGRFREDLYYRLNVLPIGLPALRERTGDVGLLIDHFARHHAPPGSAPVAFDAGLMSIFDAYAWPGNIRELSNLMQRLAILYPGTRLGRADIPDQLLPSRMRALQGTHLAAPAAPVAPVVGAGAAPGVEADALELAAGLRPASLPAEASQPAREPVATLDTGLDAPRRPDPATVVPVMHETNPIDEIILIANGRLDFPEEGVALKARLADFERKLIAHALSRSQGNISRTAQLLNLQRTTLIQKLNKINREPAEGPESEESDSG
jgi:sigma-54 specific flagellar transcriptional regulator A